VFNLNRQRKILMSIAILGSMFSLPSRAMTVELLATEDSGVADGINVTDSFGFLYSELNTGGVPVWLSLLKFDLGPVAGMTVTGAVLELTTFANHNSAGFDHDIYSSSDDSWSENTVTGTMRPADSTLTLLDTTSIDGTPQTYAWDVLGGVTGSDGLGGGNDLLTLMLRPELTPSETSIEFGPHIYSSEDSTGYPRLLLETVDPVPLPAAAWLFASALIAVTGFARWRRPA
jgi:hypothetical protein